MTRPTRLSRISGYVSTFRRKDDLRLSIFRHTASDSVLIVMCILLFFSPADSSSRFGKNKVQYTSFSWHYILSQHFDVYFSDSDSAIPRIACCWIENAYTTLNTEFGFNHRKKLPLILYQNSNLFEQTNVIMEVIPEGVGGFTELFKNRIVVPFTGSYSEFRHVLHHELVHGFQFGILFDRLGGAFLRNAAIQLPLWFAEGLAEYLSTGWDNQADMFLMDKAVFGEIPLPGPEQGGYMAYKGGQSFMHFLASTRGDSAFCRFLHRYRNMKKVDAALEKVYNESLEDLGKEWRRQLKKNYWPEIGRRDDPRDIAVSLSSELKPKAHYNLRPRISPDGEKIAYFTDYKDYTKILVVDRKGKRLARISHRGYGGYFESFHPFRSGMCWSPESKRLAFITKKKGRDQLRIIDIETKKLVHTKTFDNLQSISSPDWSPDGSSIVFCGLSGSYSDLYLYSLTDSSMTRLTENIEYEADPRFTRNGDGIVFSAEDTCGIATTVFRRTSRPASNLYFMSLEDRAIRQLTDTPWNEKQPGFSSDGSLLFFISDRNGIDNIYCAPIDSAETARPLTDIIGGCSNPDWARDTNSMVFTLFQKQKWNVYLMDNPAAKLKEEQLQTTRWIQSLHDTTVHFFKPTPIPPPKDIPSRDDSIDTAHGISVEPDEKTGDPEDSIHVEETSIDDETVFEEAISDSTASEPPRDSTVSGDSVSATLRAGKARATCERGWVPYRLKFSPDLVTLGLGISSIYGYAAQWLVVLSDLLGDHQFTIAGDIQGRLDEEIHAFVSYLNLKYRLDFGIGGFYSKNYTLANPQLDLFHDTETGGLALIRYPFSINSRIDFNVYYSHVVRSHVVRENKTVPIIPSDEPDADTVRGTPTRSFDVLVPKLSYAFDNILWGITGPVNGIRASAALTVIPPISTVDASYIALDLDFRKYLHIGRRFVWANRITCGGSVPLNDGASNRRYFLGGTDYWLFYRVNLSNYQQNLANIFYSDLIVPFRGWTYFDLTGSRYAVINTEFRFPFIKEISVVWPIPMTIRYINGVAFIDAGNVWDREDQQDILPLPGDILGGVGFGFRINLGIFILRYDRAWRTDWHTYFNRPVTYFSLGADF